MADNNAPFIRLGDDADEAPQLNYSIPEATAHVGTTVITIDVDEEMLNQRTRDQIRQNLDDKEPKRTSPTVPDLRLTDFRVINRNDGVGTVRGFAAAAQVFDEFPGSFIFKPKEGMLGFAGDYDIIKPKPRPPEQIFPKIMFFEKIQVSTFLGNYGAGRVIKTHSLFPGEKTKISVKNYQKTVTKESSKVNFGSSILDSVTEEAAVDFENSIQSESSTKYTESEADILNSQSNHSSESASGSASGLWGAAKASGETSSEQSSDTTGEWGTRQAREEMASNVESALFKHSARASSKRDVEINTSSENKSSTNATEESELVIERTIENINVSRTLNLVFRQMVQEFISVIHLTDVKIGLYDESTGPYPQYAIHELDKFIKEYFADDPDVQSLVLQNIVSELFFIFDYQNQPQPFLEVATLSFPQNEISLENVFGELDVTVPLPDRVSYMRVNKDLRTRLEDHEFIEVPGVVLKKNVITMRTEGVVVDGFLGKGGDPEAGLLDTYSAGLQTETVRELHLRNAHQELDNIRLQIANQAISEGNLEMANAYREIFCCPHYLSCGSPKDRATSPEEEERS